METKNGLKALVVDDSRTMRMLLRRILNDLGYQACEAGNGQEALALLEREWPSMALMLVDWNMPAMSGLELLKAVRSDPRYSPVTLIMVTTETEISQMSQALEAGANEYVMKPFTKDMLADKLRFVNVAQ